MVNVGDTVQVVRHPYAEGTFDKDATYKVVEYTGGLFNLEDRVNYPLYEYEIKVVPPQGKFYAGRKVRIVKDFSHHKFPIDTEVYLLVKDGDLWMASTDPDAEPSWTYAEVVPAVRYLREDEITTDVLADWEKELLAGPEDAPAEPEPAKSLWLEVVEGSKVTFKYLPTGEEFTTTVHEGDYDNLEMLGWSFDQGEDPVFEDIELLSVEQPEKSKPVLKVGSSVWDAPNNLVVFLTDNGWVDQEGDQRAADFSTMAGTGDFRVLYDAGSDD